jgi:hypothetical protein
MHELTIITRFCCGFGHLGQDPDMGRILSYKDLHNNTSLFHTDIINKLKKYIIIF